MTMRNRNIVTPLLSKVLWQNFSFYRYHGKVVFRINSRNPLLPFSLSLNRPDAVTNYYVTTRYVGNRFCVRDIYVNIHVFLT
jgi:hypothetical protein